MAITPNYSWPIPDNTDLVKDGAEAIRDLGNAIDTTVDGLPSAGLVHIETQTISAVASVSFNDVFTTEYEAYKIYFRIGPIATTQQDIIFRLRASGTDTTSSLYYQSGLFVTSAVNTVVGQSVAAGTGFTFVFGGANAADVTTSMLDVTAPKLATKTHYTAHSSRWSEVDPSSGLLMRAGVLNNNTQYDGFTFAVSTTMSGTVSVYGYRK